MNVVDGPGDPVAVVRFAGEPTGLRRGAPYAGSQSGVEDGTQHCKNANIGMRHACLDAIDYLTNFGYTKEQAYIILSTVLVGSRIAGIVDLPNTSVTMSVPEEVVEFNVCPEAIAYTTPDHGTAARPNYPWA